VIAEHIDIRAEVAKVQNELTFFRKKCLPAFFETAIHEVFGAEYADWVRQKQEGRLPEWQGATCRLAELLPLGPLSENTSKISHDDFPGFLSQEATPSFCIEEGRILWRIRLFSDWSLCSAYCPTLPPSALENRARLPKVRQWLMNLPVDSPELANALCMALPFVADADPGFAKLALDPETWRGVVQADRDITEEQRTKRVKCLDGPWFAHVLNNALLHVLGGLASNHFMMIEEFLDHPNLVGGYTHLMPHYLFAVLFEKVAILRRISEERPELW
jgi:hypothetical protein